MLLGYNTNGLSNHDGVQAIEVLAEIGYQSVAITVDHGLLSPYRAGLDPQRAAVSRLLRERGLRSVIETGARFLLDPRRKHHPTLLSPEAAERRQRLDFLKYCLELAAEFDSDCVSIWSGAKPADCDDQQALDRLAEGLQALLDAAKIHHIQIAFEPEPGMFIDSMHSFHRLLQWLDGDSLQLTLDIGHLLCQGEVPIADYIARWRHLIRNVHIEDMKAGVHRHLMFGEGDIHFPPVIEALHRAEYRGGVHVELSHHSHDGVRFAQQAFDFLAPLFPSIQPKH
jgi:sugar phosphate isomerase/epimerase